MLSLEYQRLPKLFMQLRQILNMYFTGYIMDQDYMQHCYPWLTDDVTSLLLLKTAEQSSSMSTSTQLHVQCTCMLEGSEDKW